MLLGSALNCEFLVDRHIGWVNDSQNSRISALLSANDFDDNGEEEESLVISTEQNEHLSIEGEA